MNYYASKYNDPRAIAFRKAYNEAKKRPGEVFYFEGQPYAGPPAPPGQPSPSIQPRGLLAEEGPGTAYDEKLKFIPEPITTGKAFMTKEMTERLASEEANRERLGGGPDVKFMREGAHVTPSGYVDPTQRSLQWVDPTGPIAQSPHGLDALEQEGIQEGINARRAGPPRFAAANQMGPRQIQHAPPSSVTGRGPESGGQGLLGDSPGPEGTDRSGWMGDKRFREANNKWRLASMLLNYGKGGDEGWWTV